MGAKRLIMNADDFGFSDHTVEATIYCMESGVLSSATLMANMPAFEKAVAFALKHPKFSYGAHICLTDERPLSSARDIPTLVGPEGLLWPTREFVKRTSTGRIWPRDIYREVLAQLSLIKRSGLHVTHIDTHGHVHKFPAVLVALRRAIKTFEICTVRRMQNLYYRAPRLSKRCYNDLTNLFVRRLGRTTDYFLMVAGVLCPQDSRWWPDCIERLPEGVTEIGIHPGIDEQWRRLDTLPVIEHGPACLQNSGVELMNFTTLAQESQVLDTQK